MNATEFVAGLAEVMGVERTELATVDRALAKQGLRQLARGRSRPDITLMEGIQIVCAWAGAKKLTDAAEEVTRLEHYCPHAIPEDEYELVRGDSEFFGITGVEERGLYGKNFFVVLSEVARWLREGKLEAERVWVSITKGGSPDISYDWELFDKKKLEFDWYGKISFPKPKTPPPAPVKITTSIRGPVLKWISDVTEGA